MWMSNSAIAVVISVRPEIGQWAMTAIQALVVAAYLLCLRMSAADTTELERLIGLAVVDALDRCALPIKAAAAVMGTDENNLRQALKRDPGRHLSIYRLARLPLSFWIHFLPTLSALVVKQHCTHLIEDIKFRKSA